MEYSFTSFFENRQAKVLLLVFLLTCSMLGIGYFAFLRTDYAVLFNGLRSADAAAVVSELDAKGVSYQLRDGGATILVPETEADAVRLAVTSSEAISKGTSGFELFNKSDMGLTDFAQKINYQRALQGELARTIMMMDGIADARVHLALPDRSLFRGNRSTPKAAVTITMRRGLIPDEARVAGIQRLVAASVPELALADVVLLDALGRVISAAPAADAAIPAEMEEQEAVKRYYRARARTAVISVLPDLKFDVRVLMQSQSDAGGLQTWSEPKQSAPSDGSSASPRRDFSLRISVISTDMLGPQDQNNVANAIAGAVALNPAAGDAIQFAVGPVDPVPVISPVPGVSLQPEPGSQAVHVEDTNAWWDPWWVKLVLALGLLAIVLFVRGRMSSMPVEERDAFVARIRDQLTIRRGGSDGRV